MPLLDVRPEQEKKRIDQGESVIKLKRYDTALSYESVPMIGYMCESLAV